MKRFFKYGMQKLLLLLLLINPVVRPVEVAVPALAGTEMTTLVTGGLTAILEAIRQNNKHQPGDEKLVIKIPGTFQATSVPVAGKSDEEVVDDLIGVVVAGLSKHHSLSVTDYELLDKHLRAKKQEFTKSLKEVRSIPRTETRYNLHRSTLEQLRLENRIAGEDMRQGVINRFVRDNEIALNPENIAKTRETWKRVLTIFLDCNNPNIVRRIEARLSLQVLVDINSNVFGHQIREAALNLQARYFTDNKLTHFDYDMRLPETMRFFLQASPYFLNNNAKLQEFYDFVKEEGLDIAGNSVELMRQRDHGELTGDALKESWQQCKPETIWFKGKIFPHPDNSRAILSDLENWRIHRVAVLCEQGDFDGACDIANNATKIRRTMIKLINVCRREYCNEAGILKRYEHLPSWQSLPEPGKKHVGSNISAQTRMNKRLKAEAERLRTEAVARKEAELKADADSTQEKKPKSTVPTNPSSAEEMVSMPGSLPPEQDDPEKDKEKEPSGSTQTGTVSLKTNDTNVGNEDLLTGIGLVAEALNINEAINDPNQKEPPKYLSPSDSQSAEESVSNPVPSLPPQDNEPDKQDDPEKDKKDPPPGENTFFENKDQQEHGWGKRRSHVEKTPENEKMIYDIANDPNCYYGPDKHKNHCYAKITKDGKQIWANVRDNKIREWGTNEPGDIRTYNPETGFKALKPLRGKNIPKLSGKS